MPNEEKVADEYIVLMREARMNYGPRCLLLMQVGGFHEVYDNVDPDDSPQLNICDRVLYLKVATKKMRSIVDGESRPVYMAGFPNDALPRYKAMLLDSGFTVLVVSQDEDDATTRRLTCVSSPGFDDREHRDSAVAIVFITSTSVATARYDVVVNRIDVLQNKVVDDHLRALDEARNALCQAGGASEVQIHVELGLDLSVDDDLLASVYENAAVHVKRHDKKQRYVYDLDWQERSLQSHFVKYHTVGDRMVSKLGLEGCEAHVVLSIVLLAIFVRQHDPNAVSHLPIPRGTDAKPTFLTRVLNGTIHSLDVLESKGGASLFEFLSKHVRTKMGLRRLRARLCAPIHDVGALQQRYDEIDAMRSSTHRDQLDMELRRIKDLSQMACAVRRGRVRTQDMYRVIESYRAARTAITIGSSVTVPSVQALDVMLKLCDEVLDDERRHGIDIFRQGSQHDCVNLVGVDILRGRFEDAVRELDDVRALIESFVPGCQLRLTMGASGAHQLTTTPARGRLLSNHGYSVSFSAKEARVNTNAVMDACELANTTLAELEAACENAFVSFLTHLRGIFFDDHADDVADAIGELDLVHGIACLSTMHGYRRPEVRESTHSAVKATQLRHPLIEQLVDARCRRYVPNDVELDSRNSMLLFGVNSVGKTSLLKAIAISVLMAQAGFFVPAASFQLVPYTSISLHVGGRDDMYRSQSTFVREIEHLRVVLGASRRAGSRMLFLADELGNSTEDVAAVRIVSTVLHILYTRAVTMALATHMFSLLDNPHIQGLRGLRAHHLKVNFTDDGSFVFERTLQRGPPVLREYGCEIAARLLADDEDVARRLRSQWHTTRKPNVTEPRPSRYNRRLFSGTCATCGYAPSASTDEPLAWHHIEEQCTQVGGFVPSGQRVHASSNQVQVCRTCHNDIHAGVIEITGYEETDAGMVLRFIRLDA